MYCKPTVLLNKDARTTFPNANLDPSMRSLSEQIQILTLVTEVKLERYIGRAHLRKGNRSEGPILKVQMAEPQHGPWRPIDHAGRELVQTPNLQQPVSSHELAGQTRLLPTAVQKPTRLLEQTTCCKATVKKRRTSRPPTSSQNRPDIRHP